MLDVHAVRGSGEFMKSGYAFIPCSSCKGLTAQTVAIVGEQIFVCCHRCQEIRVAEDAEVPEDFDRPTRPGRPPSLLH